MTAEAVTSIGLSSLPLVASGKVRELYKIDESTLLMVATDRISAYDVILASGIPDKGKILCQLSAHWLTVLSSKIPELKHHLLSMNPPATPEVLSPAERTSLEGRCMQVRSLKVFPLEVIVRGYITGSAWAEYQATGKVHGILQPEGLQQSQEFPNGPIYTPSTKAPAGESDVNITPEEARKIVGDKYADKIKSLALKLYSVAREYAFERGIILADTKFEFGLDEESDEVVLVDEVLTPDSSRFWPAPVNVGQDQPSFDKQYLRNWLTETGRKGKEGIELPEAIVAKTRQLYREIFERLAGKTVEQSLAAMAA